MTHPTLDEENKLWKKGYDVVIGIDEVGRGAFAGPVVAGAVAFDKNILCIKNTLYEVNDSKVLAPKKREKLNKIIKTNCRYFSIAKVDVNVINKHGIGKATTTAFRKIIKQIQIKLKDKHIYVLVDGFFIRYLTGVGLKNQKAIINGDRKSISIASASIIAKVYRDNLMKTLHRKYPFYRFSKNKGYGTRQHQEAIKKFGLTNIHRKSFNLAKYL